MTNDVRKDIDDSTLSKQDKLKKEKQSPMAENLLLVTIARQFSDFLGFLWTFWIFWAFGIYFGFFWFFVIFGFFCDFWIF